MSWPRAEVRISCLIASLFSPLNHGPLDSSRSAKIVKDTPRKLQWVVGQSFVYNGGGERAKWFQRSCRLLQRWVRLFLPPKQTQRHEGKRHKYKGLVMLQNTWQAIELSSLLDNAAQYTPSGNPVLVGPPEACTSPEPLGGGCCAFISPCSLQGSMEKVRPSFIFLFSLHNGFLWEDVVRQSKRGRRVLRF